MSNKTDQLTNKREEERKYGLGELGIASGMGGVVQNSFSGTTNKPHLSALLVGGGALLAGKDYLDKEAKKKGGSQKKLKKINRKYQEEKEATMKLRRERDNLMQKIDPKPEPKPPLNPKTNLQKTPIPTGPLAPTRQSKLKTDTKFESRGGENPITTAPLAPARQSRLKTDTQFESKGKKNPTENKSASVAKNPNMKSKYLLGGATLAGAGAILASRLGNNQNQEQLDKTAEEELKKKASTQVKDREDNNASQVGVAAGTGLVGAGATVSAVKKEQDKQKKLGNRYDNKVKNIEIKLRKAKESKTGGWGQEEFDILEEKAKEYKDKSGKLGNLRKNKIRGLALKGGAGTIAGVGISNTLLSPNNTDTKE